MTDEIIQANRRPRNRIKIEGENNPISITTVHVNQRDTLGVIFLGLLALLLFIALQRSLARNRKLMAQLVELLQR